MADEAAHRAVSFGEAPALFFRNYATFEGRSSRGAAWWWLLICVLIAAGLSVIDIGLLGAQGGVRPLSALFALATVIPNVALGMRRLHDIDKSGWWLLFALVPIGGLIVLIILFALPGTRAENRFGPDIEAGR
jgi:uncharacterized membrane protein YhaH (DUF805 family)